MVEQGSAVQELAAPVEAQRAKNGPGAAAVVVVLPVHKPGYRRPPPVGVRRHEAGGARCRIAGLAWERKQESEGRAAVSWRDAAI